MGGRIPEKFIDELLARVDIVEIIDQRVPLKKAGKENKACCPFHEEKTPSFTVSSDKQFYHCFGCGAHGTAIGFLMEYERLSFPEAVEELARHAGMEVPREAGGLPERHTDETAALFEMMAAADQYYRRQLREHPQAPQAVDYLKNRGLTGEVAARFGLGFAPESWDALLQVLGTDEDARKQLEKAGLVTRKEGRGWYDRFRGRVMFPIHDQRGRVIAFGGRVMGEGEPKYLNSPETPLFHKGREMYGLYLARDAIRRAGKVLVVEGYMDVVALAQFGVDYAVATLGTATTRDHLERIFRFAPDVVFCFDGDRAGRDAAWRALEQALPVLHEGRQVSFLFLPDGEDPDSLIRKEGKAGLEERLKAARSLPEHLFTVLSEQVDLGRMDGRARLVELARPLIDRVGSEVLRDMMLEELARRSRTPRDRLDKLLKSGEKAASPSSAAVLPAAGTAGLKQPSLVRLAIALLLAQPGLAPRMGSANRYELVDEPGMDLLARLVDLLQDDEFANTAAVLERFRGTADGAILEKLAAWDHPALHGDLAEELEGVVKRLDVAIHKQETQLAIESGDGEALARVLRQRQKKESGI